MLMQPQRPMKKGENLGPTLEFSNGDEVQVDMLSPGIGASGAEC